MSIVLPSLLFAATAFSVTSNMPKENPKDPPSSTHSPVATDRNLLKVSGEKIVNQQGEAVYLRGFGLGGMLHMENFIDGYPANEQAMREGLLKVLGKKRYDLFFNEFYKNYFTDEDAAYIQSLGLNLIRIPINYRQFEDDMNPGVIKPEAFERLDRIINFCKQHNIYTIIDLHALPGFQNQHWHSDNPTHKALFWEYKDFQDRTVHLWQAIANHYKNEPWVAGYDLINEPADASGEKLFPFYKRLFDAIRKVDKQHIMFLEGNRYAVEFDTFTEIWPSVVYTNHDYSGPGFIGGGDYPGMTGDKFYDRNVVEKDFLDRSEFMFKHKVPVWVGEFGPVYLGDTTKDNMRYTLLKDQLANYNKYQVSWCIWLYKDLGLQAVLGQNKDTPYMKLIGEFLKKKARLGSDAWGSNEKDIRDVMETIEKLFAKEFKDYDPYPHGTAQHIRLLVRNILIAEALVPEYVDLFKNLSDEQLIAVAQSFNSKNYARRERLEAILTGKEK